MRLVCPQCTTEIVADDINLDRLVAKCRRCHAVFGFEDTIGQRTFGRSTPPLDVPLPERMALDHTGAGLRIARRWFTPGALFLLFFAIFWTASISIWMISTIFGGFWPVSFFGVIHLGVGIFLLYLSFANLFNTTTVLVDETALTIRHHPLPFPGKRLEPGRIHQLYAREKVTRGRGSSHVTYELHALTDQDRHQKLVTGLTEPEQALFLEQQIERRLRITDRPMRGELAR